MSMKKTMRTDRAGTNGSTTATTTDQHAPAAEGRSPGRGLRAAAFALRGILRLSAAWAAVTLVVVASSILVPGMAAATRGGLLASADASLEAIVGIWVGPLAMMVIVMSILLARVVLWLWRWYTEKIEEPIIRWVTKDRSAS